MPEKPLSFSLHPMTPADIPAVVSLDEAAFSSPWSESYYLQQLTENPIAYLEVVRCEHQVVGYSFFWHIGDDFELLKLASQPNLRRQGIAKCLISSLLKQAKKRSVQTIILEVRPSNHAARTLYGYYKFEEVGQRKKYYQDNGEDAIILTRFMWDR